MSGKEKNLIIALSIQKSLKGSIHMIYIYIYAIDARGRARAIKPALRLIFFSNCNGRSRSPENVPRQGCFCYAREKCFRSFFLRHISIRFRGRRAQRNRKQRGVGFQPKAKHPLADRQSYNRYPPQINTIQHGASYHIRAPLHNIIENGALEQSRR